jgi:hypothetical protein
MSASRIVKFSLCATALLIFSAAGFAQTYEDIYGFKAGNAYDEAMQINYCGSFAYKVDPPATGVYPTQDQVDKGGYVFSLSGDPIPADIVGVIQFTLVNSYTVSWSIVSPYKVCAVIVKGGHAARVYYYSGGATSGSGLTPPINKNNNMPYDVSHVTFLFYQGEPPMECWNAETAWAYGLPYNKDQGNWATYTPYDPGSKVILYAGQTMNAGFVQFSDVSADGEVTVTITLNPGWRFAPVDENVKIQDYETAPSGNPSPGQFKWKGTADSGSNTFSIVVPANNYYGVHVDVERRVDCTMPM